jgi:hypothetical protein
MADVTDIPAHQMRDNPAEDMAKQLEARAEALLHWGEPTPQLNEAAAFIRAQEAENERLREALKPFAEVPPWAHKDAKIVVTIVSGGPFHLFQGDFDRARAALGGNNDR